MQELKKVIPSEYIPLFTDKYENDSGWKELNKKILSLEKEMYKIQDKYQKEHEKKRKVFYDRLEQINLELVLHSSKEVFDIINEFKEFVNEQSR